MKPTDFVLNQVVVLQPELPDSPSIRAVILGLEPGELRLELASPEALPILEKLPQGSRLKLQVWEQDILHVGDSSFLGLRLGLTPPHLTVARPQTLQKPHRRNFFRVDVSLPLTVRVIQSKNPAVPVGSFVDGLALDLSGGGIRASIPLPLQGGDMAEVVLTLPTARIKCMARIARVTEVPGGPPGKPLFSAGLEFVGLFEADQDRIVAYVFKRQAAHRVA